VNDSAPSRRARGRRLRTWGTVLAIAQVGATVGLLTVLDERPRGLPAERDRAQAQNATTTTAPETGGPLPLRTPSAKAPLRLWIGGDSLAAGPSWATFEAAQATGVVKPLAEYQVGTGIVRDEYWDWTRHMDAVLRARDPEVVMFMVGTNDDQPLAVDGVSYQPGAPQWDNEYRRRVGALMDLMTTDGRRLFWIANPPMAKADFSAVMGHVNDIYQTEAAKRPAVIYIDTWKMFSVPGSPGTYAASLPDQFGRLSEVRLNDGIHLNVEGSQRMAHALMSKLGELTKLGP